MSSISAKILDKAVSGRRLEPAEGVQLLESHDLAALAQAADQVSRRMHPEPYRTYNIDRNINSTNVCTSGCRFCAFSRPPGDPDGYVIDRDELYRKIREMIDLGGDQILLQGGMHPELGPRLVRSVAPRRQAAVSADQHPRVQSAGDRPSGRSVRPVDHRGAPTAAHRRAGQSAGRWSRDPRRSCPTRSEPRQDRRRPLAGGLPGVALPGRPRFGDHDVRPSGNAGRSDRTPRTTSRLQDETHGFTAFIGWTFSARQHGPFLTCRKSGPSNT